MFCGLVTLGFCYEGCIFSLRQALLKFRWTGRPQRETLLKLLHAVLDDDMVVRINVASVLKLGCPIAAKKNGGLEGCVADWPNFGIMGVASSRVP